MQYPLRPWPFAGDLGVIAALLLMACSSPTAAGSRRVIGFIDAGGLSVDALVAPDTARVGVPVTATVTTFGSSCLRADGASIEMVGSTALITPYDHVPLEPPSCPPDWTTIPRPVTVIFTMAGNGVLRLRGRGFDGSMTLDEPIVVRP